MRKKIGRPRFRVVYSTYVWNPKLHLIGKTGPRGGKKSLCGMPYHRIGYLHSLVEDTVFKLDYRICKGCMEKVV